MLTALPSPCPLPSPGLSKSVSTARETSLPFTSAEESIKNRQPGIASRWPHTFWKEAQRTHPFSSYAAESRAAVKLAFHSGSTPRSLCNHQAGRQKGGRRRFGPCSSSKPTVQIHPREKSLLTFGDLHLCHPRGVWTVCGAEARGCRQPSAPITGGGQDYLVEAGGSQKEGLFRLDHNPPSSSRKRLPDQNETVHLPYCKGSSETCLFMCMRAFRGSHCKCISCFCLHNHHHCPSWVIF